MDGAGVGVGYGQHLDVDGHGSLAAATAARVGQLNQELTNIMAVVRSLEAELVALHKLALWAQRDANPVDLGMVTDHAARTLL